MRYNIAGYTRINVCSEVAQASESKSAKSIKPSFTNVLSNYFPNTRSAVSEEVRARSAEKRMVIDQMLEKMRAESVARRQEFLAKLAQKDEDDDKPYDVFGKCLDIARRIMRGEKVSAEDMRFLAQNSPELLFQALLLRQEKTDRDENSDLPEDDDSPDVQGLPFKSLGMEDNAE